MNTLTARTESVVSELIRRGFTVSTMESCTGGMLASAITDVSGASSILSGAFVTYSNAAKIRCGVPAQVIEIFGVYSAQTAEAMAGVCSDAYGAKIGIGITGSLGRKDPNNPDSVPGQVYYCIRVDGISHTYFLELGDGPATRHDMKEEILLDVFQKLSEVLGF